jgi:hypothetical protein
MAAVQRLHQQFSTHTFDDIIKYYNHYDKDEETARTVLSLMRGRPFGSSI